MPGAFVKRFFNFFQICFFVAIPRLIYSRYNGTSRVHSLPFASRTHSV